LSTGLNNALRGIIRWCDTLATGAFLTKVAVLATLAISVNSVSSEKTVLSATVAVSGCLAPSVRTVPLAMSVSSGWSVSLVWIAPSEQEVTSVRCPLSVVDAVLASTAPSGGHVALQRRATSMEGVRFRGILCWPCPAPALQIRWFTLLTSKGDL
jgi:hypothetical protein